MSKFPWDVPKAETLRAVCQEIGISVNGKIRKRDDMILLLTTATKQGSA